MLYIYNVLQFVSEWCVSLVDSAISRTKSSTANGSHTPLTAQPSFLIQGNVLEADLHGPDQKRPKLSVFGSYNKIRSQNAAAAPQNPVLVGDLVQRYLSFVDTISHTQQEAGTLPWSLIASQSEYAPLMPFFEYIYSAPCTSATVERIFSHGA